MKRILLAVVAALSVMAVSSCNFSEKFIQLSIDQVKASCPMDVDEGLTMTDVNLIDGYVTYVYQCNEDVYDYDVLTNQKPAVKEAVIAELKGQAETDKNVKAFLAALKQSETGLIYQYNIPGADAPVEVHLGVFPDLLKGLHLELERRILGTDCPGGDLVQQRCHLRFIHNRTSCVKVQCMYFNPLSFRMQVFKLARCQYMLV